MKDLLKSAVCLSLFFGGQMSTSAVIGHFPSFGVAPFDLNEFAGPVIWGHSDCSRTVNGMTFFVYCDDGTPAIVQLIESIKL